MLASRKIWVLQLGKVQSLRLALPIFTGFAMLCASVLPWLSDPLGEVYSAWELPVNLGWQFRVVLINYGLLCLCCALYAFFVAYAHWASFEGRISPVHRSTLAGVLCIIPVVLFLVQYLCADVGSISHLAQHKIQMLLLQKQFGYRVAQDYIAINPLTLDISTLQGRFLLLVDQVSLGPLLACLSAWILIYYRRFSTPLPPSADAKATWDRKGLSRIWLASMGVLLSVLVVVLCLAPAALACEYQAKESLATGNYVQALRWLDTALVLNPTLNQVAYYHEERGQALYFLHPDQQNNDSRAYLAAVYREQGDYLNAYQQLLAGWQAHSAPSWMVDEMSTTLERLAEFVQPLNAPLVSNLDNQETALPWLQLLTQVDSSNVYGHYVIGRIQYDLHNYTECILQMSITIHLSANADAQSSAYTYIALSNAGQGNYLDARKFLFKAVELDPNYRNNMAREELSGLH